MSRLLEVQRCRVFFSLPCLGLQEIEAFVKKFRQPMIADFTGVTRFAVTDLPAPLPARARIIHITSEETAADLFGDGRPILFLFRDKDDKGAPARCCTEPTSSDWPGKAAEKALQAVAPRASAQLRRLLSPLSVHSPRMRHSMPQPRKVYSADCCCPSPALAAWHKRSGYRMAFGFFQRSGFVGRYGQHRLRNSSWVRIPSILNVEVHVCFISLSKQDSFRT